MTSILIIENQEPGDCATCPLFFRNAGICSWTMRFDDPCPLRKAAPPKTECCFKDGSRCMLEAVEE